MLLDTANIVSSANMSRIDASKGMGLSLQIDNLINIRGNMTKDVLPEVKKVSNNILNELRIELNKSGVFRQVRF